MADIDPKIERADRCPGITYTDMLRQDTRRVPDYLMLESTQEFGDQPLSPERYTSAAFLAREYEAMWPNVWQFAAREEDMPEPGDTVVYELGFAGQFGATTNRWLFLTGEPHAVDALLETSFIHRAPGAPRTAFFIATDRIMLVDDTGLVRKQFNGLKTSPEAVLEALARLRSQPRP